MHSIRLLFYAFGAKKEKRSDERLSPGKNDEIDQNLIVYILSYLPAPVKRDV